MEDVLLIYFKQIVSFSTQIQTNSSYFMKRDNIFILNLANYTEMRTLPDPKTFLHELVL